MTVGEYKKRAEKSLNDAGIGTAELDVLVLLEDLLHTNRAQLLAHPESELTTEQQKVLNSQIERRAKHEPLAYIRGKTEFYGEEFIVNKNVLEPRPETETMIDLTRKIAKSVKGLSFHIIDVGTGSGAIAVIAKKLFPAADVIAIDNDPRCLKIAEQNAAKHTVNIRFLQGDLLQPIQPLTHIQNSHGRATFEYVVLANLPYVPQDYAINQAASHEPKQAIFGGKDGLDLYRRLFAQLNSKAYGLKPKTYVLTESLPPQHKALEEIAKASGFKLQKTADFIQQFVAE